MAMMEIGNYKFVDPTKIDFENPEEAEAAIPTLTRAFQDQNYNVRFSAVAALKSIGTPEAIKATEYAIPALVQILKDYNVFASFRHVAKKALEDIGTPSAIKAVEEHQKFLMHALQNPNPYTRSPQWQN
jgi:HEAT repeat protein